MLVLLLVSVGVGQSEDTEFSRGWQTGVNGINQVKVFDFARRKHSLRLPTGRQAQTDEVFLFFKKNVTLNAENRFVSQPPCLRQAGPTAFGDHPSPTSAGRLN